METKICVTCGYEKSIDNFEIRKDNFKRRNQCKECIKKHNKEYREKNKEKITEQKKKYIQQNIILYKKQRHDGYVRYYEKHKEEIKKRRREEYKEDKNNQHAKKQQYHLQRKKVDEDYNLKRKLRSLVLNSLKRGGYEKNTKTYLILDAEYSKVKKHLLQTYKDNYGVEWDGKEKVHIDHKTPLASANTKEGIIKLCHYTNLQLLKVHDNLSKGSKLNWKLEGNYE